LIFVQKLYQLNNTKTGNGKIADAYKKRALNYHNVFDPELQFVRARMSVGDWKSPFRLLNTYGESFIERNSWNYSFYVPHGAKDLIKQTGGDKQFTERLDSIFTMHLPDEFFEHTEDVTCEGIMGNYVHGNEPSHHIAYFYAWTGQPWKTHYWVREIMNRMYQNSMDELCGNDDCGQMYA
jgi:putative alpha-1,2-mannosidase